MRDLSKETIYYKADADPLIELYDAMKDFYRGSIDYKSFRDKFERYANMPSQYDDFYKYELKKMDSLGEEYMTNLSNSESRRIRNAADDRQISAKEFEALEFLFGDIGYNEEMMDKDDFNERYGGGLSNAVIARIYEEDPNKMLRKSLLEVKKQDALKKLGFPEEYGKLPPGVMREAWLLYWQMLYDGSSLRTAEMARDEFLSQFDRDTVKDDLKELKEDVRRIRNRSGY